MKNSVAARNNKNQTLKTIYISLMRRTMTINALQRLALRLFGKMSVVLPRSQGCLLVCHGVVLAVGLAVELAVGLAVGLAVVLAVVLAVCLAGVVGLFGCWPVCWPGWWPGCWPA